MAYCCESSGRLVRDSWPASFIKKLTALPPVEQLAVWQRVPQDYDNICTWGTVDRHEADHLRGYVLLYSPSASPVANQPTCITLRFYRVAESLNISPIGNYNGRKEAAPRALQYITLNGGSFPQQFEPQLRVIEHLQALTQSSLCCPVQMNIRKPNTIHLQRVVFTKARSGSSITPRSVLVLGDDPHGWATAIKNDWVIAHRIVTGIYTDSREMVRKPYTVIRRGDFVEVAAWFEAVKL
ncbi:hypothetical protein C8Q78DRAFT_1070249 [Trametes maxima]|nr:hypothetical protein C8Q78DRAFT_1070249 [Trametes maxima]